jgi:endonuclease/exonuclease/phosphatase family metal-dependent hydrolase
MTDGSIKMKAMRCAKMFLFQIVIMISFSGTVLGQTAKMITYNIRYDNPNDGENIWENRKNKMAGLLNYYEPAFLGIQEGLLHQVEYLDQSLPAFDYIGVGRDDGKQKGEFCAIFYDARTYEVILDSTFWLSETPDTPSNGWDANLNRIVTYGLFENLETKERIWVMNTHFDHRGKMARENSARLIANRIEQINKDKLPLVLMGDFNATSDQKPIQILKAALSDGLEISEKPFYGPPGTSNGFRQKEIVRRIDYLFSENVKVLSYSHIDDRRDNNYHVSDHLPVLMIIDLTPSN